MRQINHLLISNHISSINSSMNGQISRALLWQRLMGYQYSFGSFNSSAQFISAVNNLIAQANHPLYMLVGIFYLYIYPLILFSDPF